MANNTNLSFPSAFYQQFIDKDGKPLACGKLYTYIAGSSTPVVTYKTISGGTESANMNTNPIILDMSGKADLVISKDTAYKFVLFDRNDVKVDEWDNVTAGGGEGGGSSEEIVVDGTTNEIKVSSNVTQGVKHYVVSLSNTIKSAIIRILGLYENVVISLENKADKVLGATTNHLAALDAEGNLTDSGSKVGDFKTKQNPKSLNGSKTKTITNLSQDANGDITATFENIEGEIVFVTTSTSYADVKALFDAKNIPVVKDGVNLYYPTHKFEQGTNDPYIFTTFPTGWTYLDNQGKLDFELLLCDPNIGWFVYKHDSIYNTAWVDAKLANKQNNLGWAVVNVPLGVDSYVKVCELNSPTGGADSYYTAFSVADGDITTSGAIPICVESGVFEVQVNCHTYARAKARWSKYKSDSNEIYGSTIKEAAIVLNGTKAEVWLRLYTLNSNTRIFIQAIDNKNKYGSAAFKYSNSVVNASTTQYDTTHTLYTYPTISSQESVTINLSRFLHNEAAVYTALDAAWKEAKPIFIYDDAPPVGYPSVKYYIAHRDGDVFYGISYDPTNNVDSIKLAYSSSTWTITRNIGLFNSAIENKVLTIYQATLNTGTDDEKDALNAKMSDVAYNGGIIILYSNTNNVYILTDYPTSNEYHFTWSQNSNSTSFDSETMEIQYSTTTHSFSSTEHHVVIDQKDVVYRIDGNDNFIFDNPSYFSTQLDNVIASKRPIEYFYTSGSVTNHYVYSDRLVGTGYKTYTFQRTYKSSASLLIVEVVELQYDSVTNNITRTTTKCGVSYTAVT